MAPRVLDAHDGVRARRHRRAGRDRARLPRPHGRARRRTGARLVDDAQAHARRAVGRAHREAVHRGVVERRHVDRRSDLLGDDAPEHRPRSRPPRGAAVARGRALARGRPRTRSAVRTRAGTLVAPTGAPARGGPSRRDAILPAPCRRTSSSSSAAPTPSHAPTAIEVLKAAVEDHGEITDEDRRAAAAASGLPEAAVYGVSTFYDDLRAGARPPPRPRVHRNRVLRGDRRRARRRAARRARPRARRAQRRRLGLAGRDRLPGLLPLLAGDPRRRRHRRGPRARSSACSPARAATPPSPTGRACSTEPVLTVPGDWSGFEHALAAHTPESLLEEVKAATRARPRRRRLPGRRQVGLRARLAGRAEVHRRQRRRGRPRLLHRQVPDGAQPRPRARGHGARRLRGRRRARLRPLPLGVPALEARARGGGRRRARRRHARRGHPRQRLQLRRDGARGRRLLRRRRGDRAAGVHRGAARHGLGAPAVPRRRAASTACRRSSTTPRRSPTSRSSRATARRPTATLSPGATPGSKLVCFNERFARPGVYEVRFGTTMRELCEELAGGMRDGHELRALQIGGPLAGILPASPARHAARLRRSSPRSAAWSATAASSASTSAPTCARSPGTSCTSARTRAAASASRAGSVCGARYEMFDADAPVDRRPPRGAARGARARQPVRARRRHAGADPQPARALPRRAGARLMRVTIDGARARGRGGHDGARRDPRGSAATCRRSASTSARRPFGACRVCLVGAVGARGPMPACTTPCRDGHARSTPATRPRAASPTAVVELVLSELPEPPAAAHRARRDRALARRRRAALAGRHARHAEHDDRHPYLAFQHELCISCGRCVRACDEVQGAFALTATGRGFAANVTAGLDAGFRDSTCVSCGACADTCPTDAITEITLLQL